MRDRDEAPPSAGRGQAQVGFPPQRAGGEYPRGVPKVDISKQLHKTKMCKHFLKGRCRYGQACSYAHNPEELRYRPDLTKTRLCKNFDLGRCNDETCMYAHGSEQLRGTDGVWKTVLCMKYPSGMCKAGRHCRFAHGMHELRQEQHDQSAGPAGAAPGREMQPSGYETAPIGGYPQQYPSLFQGQWPPQGQAPPPSSAKPFPPAAQPTNEAYTFKASDASLGLGLMPNPAPLQAKAPQADPPQEEGNVVMAELVRLISDMHVPEEKEATSQNRASPMLETPPRDRDRCGQHMSPLSPNKAMSLIPPSLFSPAGNSQRTHLVE